jgi:hypothetical protein
MILFRSTYKLNSWRFKFLVMRLLLLSSGYMTFKSLSRLWDNSDMMAITFSTLKDNHSNLWHMSKAHLLLFLLFQSLLWAYQPHQLTIDFNWNEHVKHKNMQSCKRRKRIQLVWDNRSRSINGVLSCSKMQNLYYQSEQSEQ